VKHPTTTLNRTAALLLTVVLASCVQRSELDAAQSAVQGNAGKLNRLQAQFDRLQEESKGLRSRIDNLEADARAAKKPAPHRVSRAEKDTPTRRSAVQAPSRKGRCASGCLTGCAGEPAKPSMRCYLTLGADVPLWEVDCNEE
jgi:septal ring factor EnvC (AmiA/AmiB activator)